MTLHDDQVIVSSKPWSCYFKILTHSLVVSIMSFYKLLRHLSRPVYFNTRFVLPNFQEAQYIPHDCLFFYNIFVERWWYKVKYWDHAAAKTQTVKNMPTEPNWTDRLLVKWRVNWLMVLELLTLKYWIKDEWEATTPHEESLIHTQDLSVRNSYSQSLNTKNEMSTVIVMSDLGLDTVSHYWSLV